MLIQQKNKFAFLDKALIMIFKKYFSQRRRVWKESEWCSFSGQAARLGTLAGKSGHCVTTGPKKED